MACCRIRGTECGIIHITSIIVWPQVKQQGGNTGPPNNRKLDWKFTGNGSAHQNKTQLPSQSVSPIRKLPQASYLYPSDRRQTENHNHRKPTNLITWTTALSNSIKLWAMPCRATQDRRVMVESSDKKWSTGEGNGKTTSVILPWEPHEQYEKAKR